MKSHSGEQVHCSGSFIVIFFIVAISETTSYICQGLPGQCVLSAPICNFEITRKTFYDNVRTDCGFDRSNFRLAGHVDRSKFNRIENEINLRFLLFSCFSCYLSSRCVLRNFDMKSGTI